MENSGATLDDLIPWLDGERIRRAYAGGDYHDAIIYCGQSVGKIDRIMAVKEIIESTVSRAREVLAGD